MAVELPDWCQYLRIIFGRTWAGIDFHPSTNSTNTMETCKKLVLDALCYLIAMEPLFVSATIWQTLIRLSYCPRRPRDCGP